MCFKQYIFSELQIAEMLELITAISSKLKAFKMFKAKDKKQFIVSEKTLKSICQFDNVIKD
jgi:hypothetical protein